MCGNCKNWVVVLSLVIIIFEAWRVAISSWVVILAAVALLLMALMSCKGCETKAAPAAVKAPAKAPARKKKTVKKKRR